MWSKVGLEFQDKLLEVIHSGGVECQIFHLKEVQFKPFQSHAFEVQLCKDNFGTVLDESLGVILEVPCIYPSRTSFRLLTISMTSPLLFLMPCSLRWNSVLVFFLLLFLVLFHSFPDRSYHRIPFLSCMLSTLDSVAAVQLCCSTAFCLCSSCFTSFAYLVSSHWTANSP